MTDALLLISPVIIPFIGAAFALLARKRAAIASAISLITNLLLGIGSALLLMRAMAADTLPITRFGDWPQGMGLSFSATLPGVALVMVTALVALSATIYSPVDIGPRRRRAGYDPMMLAMIGAVNGAFLTDDLFNLYVWFELALLCALGLLTLDRRAAQIHGAIRYAAFAMVAATFILMGIGMIYGITATLNIHEAAAALAATPPSVASATAAALLLGGFALKAGLVPFHLWLPTSYHVAPATVTAVFAGLLTKMGFYALLIVFAGVFGTASGSPAAAQLVPLFGIIAAATMLVCVAGALAQTDMRRLLAYHVIAQVGYMMAGLAIATREGVAAAIFYMIHSIIVQANLFLGAGLIRRASGSWDMRRTGGMVRHDPIFSALFAVPVLSLAGIPPFSGFWAKMIVIRESLDVGMAWIGGVALITGLLTIVSMATFWSDACWKDTPGQRIRAIPRTGLVAMAILSTATILIGLFPQTLWAVAQQSAAMLEMGR